MSVSINAINSLLQPVQDHIEEGYLQLNQLGKKFLDIHQPSSEIIGFIETVMDTFQQIRDEDGTDFLTDEKLDEIRDSLPSSDDVDIASLISTGATINAVDSVVTLEPHTFFNDLPGRSFSELALKLKLDGVTTYLPTCVTYNGGVLRVPTVEQMSNTKILHEGIWNQFFNNGGMPILRNVINKAADGIGLNYFFGKVLTYTAEHGFDQQSANVIANYVNSFQNISDDIKNMILTTSVEQPIQLVTVITNYIKGCQQAASQNDASIFSSTNIIMADYVSGIIVGVLSTSLQILTAVATAISRIAGAIMAVVSTVFSIFSNLYYRTQDAQLNFGINIKANHCFDFVVSQSKISAPGIRSLMAKLGVNSFVLTPKGCPSVFSIFSDINDENYVLIEERLSCDYDITRAMNIASIPDLGGCLLLGNSSGYIAPTDIGLAIGLYTKQGSQSFAISALSLAELSFSPFNVSRISGIVSSYTGTLNYALALRLASAVILWSYSILRTAMYNYQQTVFAGYELNRYKFGRKINGTFYDDDVGINVIANAFNEALYAILSDSNVTKSSLVTSSHGTAFKYTSKPTSFRDYSGSALQNWIETAFLSCFNGLSWVDTVNDPLDLAVYQCFNISYFSVVGDVVTEDTKTPMLQESFGSEANVYEYALIYTEANYYLFNYYQNKYLYFNMAEVATESSETGYYEVVPGWITDGSITLPTVTWTAVVMSIIADVVCMIGIALVVLGALYGRAKIASFRARKQASVEANWYAYQDALNATYSNEAERKQALNQAWGKYNKSRFGYNILARLTGGTTLSKGLYDENSESSVVGYLRSITGGNENVNLNSVLSEIERESDSVKDHVTVVKTLIAG